MYLWPPRKCWANTYRLELALSYGYDKVIVILNNFTTEDFLTSPPFFLETKSIPKVHRFQIFLCTWYFSKIWIGKPLLVWFNKIYFHSNVYFRILRCSSLPSLYSSPHIINYIFSKLFGPVPHLLFYSSNPKTPPPVE